MTDYNLTVNVNNNGMPPVLDVIQGDSGRNIVIRIADMDLTNKTARVYVLKPSGLDVYSNAVINNDKITVELTRQMLAEHGSAKMQVSIYNSNNEKRVSTFYIYLNIEKSLQEDGMINSSVEYEVLDDLIAGAEGIMADMPSIKSSMALIPGMMTALVSKWGKDELRIEKGNANVGLKSIDSQVGFESKASRYCIIGNTCFVQFYFNFNGTVPSSGFTLDLDRLPVTPASVNTFVHYMYCTNIKTPYPSPQSGCLRQFGTSFRMYASNGTSRDMFAINTTWLQEGTTISGSFWYTI